MNKRASAGFLPLFDQLMHHGSVLTHEELRAEAHRLAKESSRTYAQIANDLNVSRAAISKAVRTTGSKYQRLQKKIIQEETEYEVDEHTLFFVVDKKEEVNIEKIKELISYIQKEEGQGSGYEGETMIGITEEDVEHARKVLRKINEALGSSGEDDYISI